MTENAIAHDVVDAAYRIHSALGPGLLESVYRVVLASELEKRGHEVQREHPVPIVYAGLQFEVGFRADLTVANKGNGRGEVRVRSLVPSFVEKEAGSFDQFQ